MENIEELARLERNRYVREWRANNKDKVQLSNKRYWIKRAEKKLAEEDSNESNKND